MKCANPFGPKWEALAVKRRTFITLLGGAAAARPLVSSGEGVSYPCIFFSRI
jgi:hypothetical protein